MSKPLRDLADVYYGKSPNEVVSDESTIPIIGTGGIYGRATRAMYQGPAVVVPRKGSLGNPQFIGEPFWPVDTTYAVLPKPKVDAKWLYYSLAAFDLTKLNEATGVPSINRDWLYRVKLGSDEFDGQRRISEILSTVDEAIEQTEALIAKYQQVKAGLMHDLFTRGVSPDGRLRPTYKQAPHLYKESPLGWIPKEWGVVTVRECGSVKLGRQRSPDQFSGRWTTPYLRVANVFDGFIDYSDILEMDFTPDERRTFSVQQGDILLNEGQSLELVGRCAIFNGPDEVFCFQNTLVRFRTFDRQYPPFYRFLFKWFLDCRLFIRIAKQTTSVAHLGADRFSKMYCVSVPYEEQIRISDRLAALQARLDTDSAHAAKLRQQKHGLMQDLLTGRVRVKVAEPASR